RRASSHNVSFVRSESAKSTDGDARAEPAPGPAAVERTTSNVTDGNLGLLAQCPLGAGADSSDMNKREQSVPLVVVAAVALLGMWTCGGSSGGAADAGPDAPADAGGADSGTSGTLACDPAAQDCPADQKC